MYQFIKYQNLRPLNKMQPPTRGLYLSNTQCELGGSNEKIDFIKTKKK